MTKSAVSKSICTADLMSLGKTTKPTCFTFLDEYIHSRKIFPLCEEEKLQVYFLALVGIVERTSILV